MAIPMASQISSPETKRPIIVMTLLSGVGFATKMSHPIECFWIR